MTVEVSFAAHLVACHGRPMERALVRARQRYGALIRREVHPRVSVLRRAYARKRGRSSG